MGRSDFGGVHGAFCRGGTGSVDPVKTGDTLRAGVLTMPPIVSMVCAGVIFAGALSVATRCRQPVIATSTLPQAKTSKAGFI